MAELRIDTAGMTRLVRSLDSLRFTETVSDAIADAAVEFEERIRPATPIDTGRLLLSGNVVVDVGSVEFVNDAAEPGRESYASFVHDGEYESMVEFVFDDELGRKLAIRLELETARMFS